MSDRDTKLIRQARTTRLTFPDDEAKQAWLPLLLEAYAIVDAGINEAIRREEAQGRALTATRAAPPAAAATPPSPSIRSNSSASTGTLSKKSPARCASN